MVDYRWAADDDDSAIGVLGRALGQLPSPFDLSALDQALSAGELRSATLDGAARNAISASISVGESVNLVQGTAVQIGLDFTSGRGRHSRVQLRVEQDTASTEPALSVELSRRSSAAEMSRIGVGLIVDPSPAVERFAAGLAERAGEAAAAFKHMEQVFPPSRAINFMDLDEAVRAVDLAQLQRAFVDTTAPEALIERFRRKVMQVIDAEQDVWEQDPAILARVIARRAASDVGLGLTDVQHVVDAMEVRLSSALASLHNKLKSRLHTVPEIPKPRGLFSIVGAGSRNPQTEALGLLRRAQGLLGSFSSAVERAAKSKVVARIGQTMREEQGREVDWRLRLFPSRAGAAEFYQSLFTGDLDAVLQAVSELGNNGRRAC